MTGRRAQAAAAAVGRMESKEKSPRSSAPKVQLSCVMCRQRKVRCDKLSPCKNCERLGATCIPVQRARLPRGRSSQKKSADRPADTGTGSDLESRVASMEQLLYQMTRQDNYTTASIGSIASAMAQDGEAHLGSSLWKESSNAPDSLTYDPDHTTDLEKNLGSYYGTLLGTTTPDSLPNSFLTSIDASPLSVIPQLQEFLCHIYLAQVDPVFKILHRPSLRALLLEEKPYLHYDLNHPAPAALKCAVFYAAACSISEVNWPTMMGSSRPAVLARYQSETEAALRRAEYITTNDLTVLQAFVLSLLCARSHDQSRRSWTMLSMAVRIAQALCLHIPRPTFAVSPFEKEMRRRLWIAIGLLDVQASLDRASEPMILTSWLQFHPPSNINDEDVSASFQGPVQQSEDFTDTTFALMVLKAQCTARLLNVGDTAESPAMALHTRQLYVVDFQRTRYQLLRNCRPESDSFHWYAGQVADCIDASLQLIALRPLQRNAKLIAPSPTRGLRILKLSVDVLQKTQILYDDIRGRPWRWFEGIFVPWHALAVALAELCELEGPAAMMETYWLPVKQAFDRFGSLVADSQQGMLWKPMEKLMTQARRKRNLQLADSLLSSRVLSLGSEDVASSAASDWNSPFLILTPMEAEGDEEQDQGTPIITSGDDLGSWPDSWNLPCTIDWPSDLLAPMNG